LLCKQVGSRRFCNPEGHIDNSDAMQNVLVSGRRCARYGLGPLASPACTHDIFDI